jgi:hypothetical protein
MSYIVSDVKDARRANRITEKRIVKVVEVFATNYGLELNGCAFVWNDTNVKAGELGDRTTIESK